MNSAQRTLQLAQLCSQQIIRRSVSSTSGNAPANWHKIKAKQAKFQMDNGLPVHLKGGVFDKILYQTTMGLCLIGLGMTFKLIYEISFPKKA